MQVIDRVGYRFFGLKMKKKLDFVAQLEHRARSARFQLLIDLARDIHRPLTILDVGGTDAYWRELDYAALGPVKITLYNVFEQLDLPMNISAVVGDARDLSRYRDKEFDIVYSNAVINLVGTFIEQQRMAAEIRRVGKRYLVQCPNQAFPLDWRTLVPFFHLLPVALQAWCFRHFPVGVYPRVKDANAALFLASRVRDLTRTELTVLFPGATIVAERFLGLAKSFMVHDGFS